MRGAYGNGIPAQSAATGYVGSNAQSEPGCKRYELYESDSRGRLYLCETWESQAALDQILRQTIANPIGPEFMAPPARNTVAAQETQSPPRIT
ncbi:MAG: hypothetical protein DMG84_21585 [Acidobacteria bacterium]|nr:MAG: hypothetical protein DMG84_21585 [Acidobacteriota bacterium]